MRGDVYELSAAPKRRGHEQPRGRYAVVVQSDLLPLSTWLVAPTSTSARDTSFRPVITIDGAETKVLAEQTAAVDPQRLGEHVGHLTHSELDAVTSALRVVLDIS